MSAHAYARRPAAPSAEPERQPTLFALPGGAETLPLPERAPQRPALAPVRAPQDERASARVAGRGAPRTLGAELDLAWTALTAGAPAACIMCGGRMEPHGGGPGGACSSCGTTVE